MVSPAMPSSEILPEWGLGGLKTTPSPSAKVSNVGATTGKPGPSTGNSDVITTSTS